MRPSDTSTFAALAPANRGETGRRTSDAAEGSDDAPGAAGSAGAHRPVDSRTYTCVQTMLANTTI